MNNSCRLCLNSEQKTTDVFGFKGGHRISDLIELICIVRIEKGDVYSKLICLHCLDIVYKANNLRILSIRNNQLLKTQSDDNFFVKNEENVEDLKHEHSPSMNQDEDHSTEYKGSSYSQIMEDSLQSLLYTEGNTSKSSYECDQCPEKTSKKRDIEFHIKKEHLSICVCYICSKNFCSEVVLEEHMRKKHLSVGSLKSLKKLELHQEIHSYSFDKPKDDMIEVKCRLCLKLLQCNDKKISAHINHHKSSSAHDKASANSNIIEKVPDVKIIRDNYESFVCPHCGKIFRTNQILQQHIKRHFDTCDKYACKLCPQKFKSWGELYYHKAVHTTERNFVCELCSKAFKAKRDLRNHKIRHETKDVKNFQCSYCQLMLKSKYTLNRHILIHTGEKRFQCIYCFKPFTQKNELNKHLRIHVGECTYKCDQKGCAEAFRLLAELRLHQQIHYHQTF